MGSWGTYTFNGWLYDWFTNSGKIDLVVPFTKTNNCIIPTNGTLSTKDINSTDNNIVNAYNNKQYTCDGSTKKCTIVNFYQPTAITKENQTCINISKYSPSSTDTPPWTGFARNNYTNPHICGSGFSCGGTGSGLGTCQKRPRNRI